MNDDEWLEDLLASRAAADQERLETTRRAALASGKEPFDLDALYRLWPWCPDMQLSVDERARQRGNLEREWETAYYLTHRDDRTMEAFAFRMRELQRTGRLDG